MKKLSLLIALFTFSTIYINGQNLADNYVKGSIYLNDGQVIEAYLFFDILYPEQFQKSVSYINEATYQNLVATDKLKTKEVEEVKAKDAKYFQLADGRKFVSLKYADLNSAGAGSIPTYYFFEELVSGKISLYKKYNSSVAITITDESKQAEREWVKSNFELLIQAGDKGPKNISTIALPDYISDNAEILEKFNNNQYGKLKQVFGKKIKMGEVKHSEHEKDFINILNDYNK